MPVYEYLCEKCGHEFEREQRITDNPVKTCPNCKARRVKKLISQTSFVLKGGGWYADGYGNANDAGSKDADASGSEDASKSTSDKSEDKDSKPSKQQGIFKELSMPKSRRRALLADAVNRRSP